MAISLKNKNPWIQRPQELFEQLKTSETGLTSSESRARLIQFGPNETNEKRYRGTWHIFVSQFLNALVLVLIVAAIISYFLGEQTDALVILAIVFLNTFLGFFQENKAERILQKLEKYIARKAKVLRDSVIIEIYARDLVPGDIVYFEIGDVIPADIRLLDTHELSTDEATLTGESYPVHKQATVLHKNDLLPNKLINMAFMATIVSSGSGHGIVTATGKDTIFGKTVGSLAEKPSESDFERNISNLSNFLLKVILAMTVFIFAINSLLGKGIFNSLLFAVALAVGITPEVLPIIITISLSRGALRMAKEKTIMRKLSAVEDLGNVDILCSDKTGTLTEGTVVLHDFVSLEGVADETVLLYGLLCSDHHQRHDKTFGNPIDQALWHSKYAHLLNQDKYEVLKINEFDFERKRMSALVQHGKKNILIAKGSSLSILHACTHAIVQGKQVPISKHILKTFHDKVALYEDQGFRTIAVASKPTSKITTTKDDEKDLAFMGFLLLLDPPKRTVEEALHSLERLGVTVKIITGDSRIVTEHICKDVGLSIRGHKIITGEELVHLSPHELSAVAQKHNVFAQITPELKNRIIHSLMAAGHIVGYLGDGVNDVPALKTADVGISVDTAVGVAKEAADVILLQKSLLVLAQGIKEGRKTFGNIMKYIINTISANYGNMFTVAASSVFLPFIPLLPSQILLLNFLSDAPNLTISTDNVDEQFLKKPRHWNFQFIFQSMTYFGLLSSFFDLLLIFTMMFVLRTPANSFRTAWFVESIISEIIIVFALRTAMPFFKSKPSIWLITTSFFATLLTFVIVYTTFGAEFEFVPLSATLLMVIAGILLLYFIFAEITKRYLFKKFEF